MADGRYRSRSGHGRAWALTISVENDPTATLAVHCGSGFAAQIRKGAAAKVAAQYHVTKLPQHLEFISSYGNPGWLGPPPSIFCPYA